MWRKAVDLMKEEVPKNLNIMLDVLLPEMTPEARECCVQLAQRQASLRSIQWIKANINEGTILWFGL